MDDRFDPMVFLLLTLSFAAGLAFLWAAVDALRTGRAVSIEGRRRTGTATRSRQPGSYWVWVFVYVALGGALCGFAIWGTFFAPPAA
jgi:hypothetical protein